MWPGIQYEECRWERDFDSLALVSKNQRRKIAPTYKATIPAAIAREPLAVSTELSLRIEDAHEAAVRFDQAQADRDYDLPALVLRSESSSSSQIERLTSSVRNVALAELSDKVPANAKLIARNVAAMREALAQEGPVDVRSICSVHDLLMADTDERLGLRTEQVWIGGSPYSPHGTLFVPPRASRLAECLNDLIAANEPT